MLFLHISERARVVVVFLNVGHDGAAAPELRKPVRYRTLAALIAAGVAEEDDLLEAVHLEGVRYIGEHGLERLLAGADRARAPHVTARRLDVAFRNEREDGGAQGVAELARDRLAVGMQYVVVLAGGQPGTVRLHATRGDQHRPFPCGKSVTHVHPRHFLHPNRRRRGKWVRRVRAIVDVGLALPSTQAEGCSSPALLCENGCAHQEHEADGQEGLHGRLRKGLWRSRQGVATKVLSIQRLGWTGKREVTLPAPKRPISPHGIKPTKRIQTPHWPKGRNGRYSVCKLGFI